MSFTSLGRCTKQNLCSAQILSNSKSEGNHSSISYVRDDKKRNTKCCWKAGTRLGRNDRRVENEDEATAYVQTAVDESYWIEVRTVPEAEHATRRTFREKYLNITATSPATTPRPRYSGSSISGDSKL